MSASRLVQGTALAVLLSSVALTDALAIPAFARRYKVSCMLCHNPMPKLTDFGERFAANGFRMASGESMPDSVSANDPLLSLPDKLPLAVRLDLYAQAYANGKAATDFQSPYGLKLLSGGAISKKLSYYFYTFLAERGEIGGIEDAFLYLNDIGDKPVDLAFGQYQVSDPLFKRELRLEFEDYAVYRARVGDVPVDLTYDRGLMAAADVAGFTVTGEILNGNGIGPAQSDRHFDNDAAKNLFLNVTRDVIGGVRVGVFGYSGRSSVDGIRNQTKMIGADATLSHGALELNGQYVHRTDNRPTYTQGEPESRLDGGFAELVVRPAGSRWYGFGLYNLVTTDQPLLNVRLGGPEGVRRHETYSAGFGRLERRNFRWTAEAGYDTQQEAWRWTFGLVTAF
ncbi:MAG TPA: hypothetical protein VF187_07895 [Gemmatimonadales bacterium]